MEAEMDATTTALRFPYWRSGDPLMYQLTIDHQGQRCTSRHRRFEGAHRALVAFVVVTDCYLHEQPVAGLERRYLLVQPTPSPRRPQCAGHALIEALTTP